MTKNADNTVISRQSFEDQVRLSEDLKKYLHELQERLSLAAQSYQQKCNFLYESGMMEETLNELMLEYMPSTVEQIMNVAAQINERDIPFIEKHIAKMEQSFFHVHIRDVNGNIVARSQGDRIVDNYGNWLYGGDRNRGNRIYDDNGEWKYEVRGDRIYDTSGNWVYEIRDDRIYDTAGNWLGTDYQKNT